MVGGGTSKLCLAFIISSVARCVWGRGEVGDIPEMFTKKFLAFITCSIPGMWVGGRRHFGDASRLQQQAVPPAGARVDGWVRGHFQGYDIGMDG